jgi:hypothetical protein
MLERATTRNHARAVRRRVQDGSCHTGEIEMAETERARRLREHAERLAELRRYL